ncbi:MAG: hypothetical protein ACR2M6_00505 [Vampirovibrionia bacterium]
MAMYKKNTRRKVVKGKKMKRSIATRRKHKKSNGRRTRRGGGFKDNKPKPHPIQLPKPADMARREATPSTAVVLDRRGQDVLLQQGRLPTPMPGTKAARNEKVSGRIEKGFGDAFAAAEARKAEQAQLMD